MAGPNNDPIYSRSGDVQSSAPTALIAAVNASLYDGAGTIGTDIYKVWQADATNGGFLQRVRVKYVSNSTTASNACVMKFFISSAASGSTTNTNAFFFDELVLPSTGTLTTTTAAVTYDIPFNFALPAGWTVLVKITVAQPSSSGFIATGIGGAY